VLISRNRPKKKPYLGSAEFTRTPVSRLQRRFSTPENNSEDPYGMEQCGSILYRHPKENLLQELDSQAVVT
jgi:hypothetical protein